MQVLFLLFWCTIHTLVLPINGAIIPSSTSPNPPLLDGHYNSTLGGNIDPHFSLQSHYYTARLPATAVLMNTLTLLTEAADLEYNDAFDFNRHATFADYPSVSIDFQTVKAKQNIECAFLIWGLYLAAQEMILDNKFLASQFDLVWKSRIIARLRYEKPKPLRPSPEIGGGEQEIDHMLASPTPDTKTSSSPSSPPHQSASPGGGALSSSLEIQPSAVRTPPTSPPLTLRLQYLAPHAHDIPIWALFMTIFATLRR